MREREERREKEKREERKRREKRAGLRFLALTLRTSHRRPNCPPPRAPHTASLRTRRHRQRHRMTLVLRRQASPGKGDDVPCRRGLRLRGQVAPVPAGARHLPRRPQQEGVLRRKRRIETRIATVTVAICNMLHVPRTCAPHMRASMALLQLACVRSLASPDHHPRLARSLASPVPPLLSHSLRSRPISSHSGHTNQYMHTPRRSSARHVWRR